jgi:hypothetical protein
VRIGGRARADSDANFDHDSNAERNRDTDADADCDGNSNGDRNRDSNANRYCDADTDANCDRDSDLHADRDVDADSNRDAYRWRIKLPGRIQRQHCMERRFQRRGGSKQHGKQHYQRMATDVVVAGESDDHQRLERDLRSERPQRDADQCLVECGHLRRRQPDRDRFQRQLQRDQSGAGGFLSQRKAVRSGGRFRADSDANFDHESRRNADAENHHDPDA